MDDKPITKVWWLMAVGAFCLAAGLNSLSHPEIGGAQSSPPLVNSEKIALSNKIYPDGAVSFQIVLRNGSGATVTGVRITDTLHARLAFVSASVAPEAWLGSCSATGNVVSCDISAVPVNSPVTVTLQAQVKPSSFVIGTVVTNTAWIDDGTTVFQTNVVTATMADYEIATSQIDDPWNGQRLTTRGTYTVRGRTWTGAHPEFPTTPTLRPIAYVAGRDWYFVEWEAAASALVYVLQESEDPYFDQIAREWEMSSTSQYISGQAAGTYYYRVKARNAAGDSRWSDVEAVTVVPSAWLAHEWEAAPARPMTDAPQVEITVRRVGETTGTWVPVTTVVASSIGSWWDWSYVWALPEEQEPTQYVLQTRARMADGVYGPVDTITVTISNGKLFTYMPLVTRRWPPIPYPPQLAPISNPDGDNQFTVSWTYNDASIPATSYTLQRANDPAFTVNVMTYPNLSETAYAVTTDAPGVYYYRVRGVNSYGNGEWSNVQSVTVLPDTPTLNAINNPDQLSTYLVSWNAAWGAVEYVLEEATVSDFSNAVVVYTGSALAYTASDRAAGTYYYRVLARYGDLSSAWSNVVATTVSAGYFDDFSDKESGWFRGVYEDDDRGVASGLYFNGTYRLKILLDRLGLNNKRMVIVQAPYRHPDNTYDVEVDHRFVVADDQAVDPTAGKAGLVFRADYNDSCKCFSTIYVFEWNFEGACSMHRYANIPTPIPIVWTLKSDPPLDQGWLGGCVPAGYDKNVHVLVQVRGDVATIYANDKQVGQFTGIGSDNRVGLITGSWERTPVESLFDNFRVTDR